MSNLRESCSIFSNMKYLKKFNTHTEYEEQKDSIQGPNVVYCEAENEVHYNKPSAWMIGKYNVTSTTSPTVITSGYTGPDVIKATEIDGVLQTGDNPIVVTYTFNTTGIHTVRFELTNPSGTLGGTAPIFFSGALVELIIPDGVTSIGKFALYGCNNLTKVVIPNTVTSIGDQALYNCNSLVNVRLPKNLTTLGSSAFYGCTSLISIEIPGKLTNINSSTFQGCTSLTDVVIEDGVASIGDNAFDGCTNLANITVPHSVTSIGSNAFKDCANIKYINYDAQVNFSTETFGNHRTLETLILGDSVTSIEYGFFRAINTLETVVLKGVTSITGDKFDGCGGLKKVVLGDNLSSIGSYAFSHCYRLIEINLPEYSSLTTIDHGVFLGCAGLSRIIIPGSIISIGQDTFVYCSNLCEIVAKPAIAPTFPSGFNPFNGICPNGTLYVPQGARGYDTWMDSLPGGWIKVTMN